MPLSDAERASLSQRVKQAEARTGAQIVVAVVARSDAYPELPWKAFALGASAGSLAAVGAVALRPGVAAMPAALGIAMISLGAGAALALAAGFLRPVARALLDGHRADGEVRQHAQALFLRHELFRTQHRVGVLILASEFERRVVVLPDVGLEGRARPEELQAIVAAMTPAFAAGRTADAFVAGLAALEALLVAQGVTAPGQDEIAQTVVEEDR